MPLSTRRACKQGRSGAPYPPCRICLLSPARGQADCSSRPRASRSSSRGRGVGPVFQRSSMRGSVSGSRPGLVPHCLSYSQSQVLFGGNPVNPTRAHFRAHRCSNRRCFISSVSCLNCGNLDHTLRSGFSSALEIVCPLSRTTGGGRNRGRNSLRVGGWWFAPKSTSIRREIGPCGNLGNSLVLRARVRDDSGRSPQIDLEPE